MKYNLLKRCTLLILFFALMESCTRENDEPQAILPGYIDYFNYQIGSYFVMKDVKTGLIDTFKVTSYNKSVSSGTNQNRIYIYIYNSVVDTMLRTLEIKPTSCDYSIYNSKHTENSSGYNLVRRWPFEIQDTNTNPSIDIYISEAIPAYFINGVTYDNVFKVSIKNSDIYSAYLKYNDTFYLNKTHGLLRIVADNTVEKRDWQLINSKIVR